MALVHPDGRFLRVNSAVCQMLGYREEELLALTIAEITHPDDMAADMIGVRRGDDADAGGEAAQRVAQSLFIHNLNQKNAPFTKPFRQAKATFPRIFVAPPRSGPDASTPY